jgi:DNA-binding XRE family transcriptional regulator
LNEQKRKRLEAAGFTVGDTQEFLGLTDEEVALIDMKLALAKRLRAARAKAHLSQQALAKRIGSSQSRVAKAEAGDSSVSMELLVRALLATGQSRRNVGAVIGSAANR